jgi:hypothetical protein
VSDDLYGSGSRYVSKQRLEAMLDKEWADLQTQLGKTHGPQTRFFSFADTVEARKPASTASQSWRFSLKPAIAKKYRVCGPKRGKCTSPA